MEKLAIRPDQTELTAVIELVAREAGRYLDTLDELPVRHPHASEAARSFDVPFPEEGSGALEALRELIDKGLEAGVNSAGPRFFHWVIGGTTPAALGADWLATTLDQLSSGWPSSPLAVQLELVSLKWLKELFGLDPTMHGYITTGAMMANFTGLAAGRQWCGEQLGVDVAQAGLHALEPIPVFTSGLVHITSYKSLAMLGMGRDSMTKFSRDAFGRLDAAALENALKVRNGKPSIIIANAGEVNAGEFDPIETMADLAKKYNAWLHVDGAFGLFAATSPRTAHLCAGVERADSVTVDGHKWLNVPYDCGFSFVRDPRLLLSVFSMDADYLPDPDVEPIQAFMGPESSRRARSLSVWATLRAYGKSHVREMVEDHLDLAQHLARRVDDSPVLTRLAEVPLNIVCFRFDPNPGQTSEAELDRINNEIGEAIIE
ncbi:MAG: pyridoxal-dependent decarboxylase, partial [Planctomycetota bacterium]|nr:pyridoxal-dependent decarboxylase [Planctomycetota bacterium]